MASFKISKFTIFLLFAAVIFAAAAFYYINTKTPHVADNNQQQQASGPAAGGAGSSVKPSSSEPTVLNLPIPFTSQAPTGNWDEIHNEDCEEAVSVMANAYLTGDKDVVMPAAQVETEMTTLNNWEDSHFGYHLDTTAQETAQMIAAVYGLKATVQQGYSLQDIKDQLNMHNVVILPEDGQLLDNPNYKTPGPIYHMLVIRGYTATSVITNDSGTKHGENYPYTFNTLYAASADWDHSTNTIDPTKKVMIIVSKN